MEIDYILESSLENMGIKYSVSQKNTLLNYLNLVYKYNKKFNLTGTKDRSGILIRHIMDSLSLLEYKGEIFNDNKDSIKVLDAGTGAGLPGIPLAIFLRNKVFYLLDTSQKKISFLEMLIKELELKNVMTIRGRAELLSRQTDYRESFDIVLARAVAVFNILSELIIPFCRINGKIVFYKSVKVVDELRNNKETIIRLGGEVENLLKVRVPYLEECRFILIVKKAKRSPEKYPRSFNKIKKNPL